MTTTAAMSAIDADRALIERGLDVAGDRLDPSLVRVAVRSPLDAGESLDALVTLTCLLADAAIEVPADLAADIAAAAYHVPSEDAITAREVDRLAEYASRLVSS